uniref:Uncharacterized protein n=1 Tax=Helianthus annuus TaxID=4232 RepID=A0A251RPJ6_HELAN
METAINHTFKRLRTFHIVEISFLLILIAITITTLFVTDHSENPKSQTRKLSSRYPKISSSSIAIESHQSLWRNCLKAKTRVYRIRGRMYQVLNKE